ncbi:MAG: hypothetical protein IPN19_13950 [Elusimicrobia bacterium]|nr:hypothetical protein [Elusimicrobiota bacterium]
MKKLLTSMLVLGCVVLFASALKAGQTENLNITVLPTGTKSITLSTGTLVLGSHDIGDTDILSSSVTVTNDGNVQCILGLRVVTDDNIWDAHTSAGPDQYNLRALFNIAAPANTDFDADDDVLDSSVVQATGLGGVYSGDENGSAFVAADTLGLWFKLDMPTSSTVQTLRTFVVEVSAN